MQRSRGFLLAWFACTGAIGLAQTTSVNISFNLTTAETFTNRSTGVSNATVAPLGSATIQVDTTQPVDANGNKAGTLTGTVTFSFNRLDGFSVPISIPLNFNGSALTGTVGAGTGAYKGATGSANLTLAYGSNGAYTISGTGSVTASGKTTAFTLSSSSGTFSSTIFDTVSGTGTAQITPLSSKATATLALERDTAANTQAGTLTIALSSTDSIAFHFAEPLGTITSSSATVAGGTGAYLGATGSASLTWSGSDPSYSVTGTGSITQHTTNVPVITEVTTAFGAPASAQNAWIVIKGRNLVPPTTPPAGYIWTGALEFLFGNRMPTQLQGVNVSVNGQLAYVYFFCSAVTNPTGCPSDQINVLTPLDSSQGPVRVAVVNNGVTSESFVVPMREIEPSFLLFSPQGYIVATHLDYSLVGPASLYPNYSTPAKVGETILLYGVGFGLPSTPIIGGSATQFGPLPQTPSCFLGNNPVQVTAAYIISPGLAQLNVVVPAGTPPGDNPFFCQYQGTAAAPYFTPAANLITVQ